MNKFNIIIELIIISLIVLISINIKEIKEDINTVKIEVYMNNITCPICNKKGAYKYIYTQEENDINFVIDTILICEHCDKEIK